MSALLLILLASPNLTGTWRHAGPRDKAAVEAAIEAVVAKMNFLVRPIARGRLREANRIPQRLRLLRAGEAYVLSLDGRAYRAVPGAEAILVTGLTGDPLRLTLRREGQALVWDYAGESGGRVNRLTPSKTGLRLEVTVRSPKLPGEIRYSLSYQR